MKCKILAVSGLIMLMISLNGQAEMYKQVDEQGRVSYSNVPSKGSKKVELAPLSVMPSVKPKAADPQEAERDAVARASALANKEKEARRKELQAAIASEEALLAEAKQALKGGEENPEMIRTTVVGKDGKKQVVVRRAMGRYEEKVSNLQAAVTEHEKKLESLKKELQALPQ